MLSTFYATTDQDRFRSPEAWDFAIYSLDPKDFWFSKATMPVVPGCELVRYDFRGRVRFRAALQAPRLQINFIDSYSTIESRLQGKGKIDSVVMVTLGGNSWDGLSDVGALGIELNFDEHLASRIVPAELKFALDRMISKERSVIGPVTQCGQQLKLMALRHLARMDQQNSLFHLDQIGQDSELFQIQLEDVETQTQETLVEMAQNLLEELALTDFHAPEISSGRRRAIALKVEQMLWEPPFLQDESFSATLEEFATLFGVSTRTIQIAIQEQFGIGFVALRRLVRLTQLRRAMLESKGAASLSALASDYRLHFGRLAGEYSELFGIKPSHELRQLRKAQAGTLARVTRSK
jgi:hypothetical protein